MIKRRFSILTILAASMSAMDLAGASTEREQSWITVDDFNRADSLYHGDGWESLNPGYWKIQNKALGRRFQITGIGYTNWAPSFWFPWHYETHLKKPMPMSVSPITMAGRFGPPGAWPTEPYV
ncbi:MAG: hypothetical protein JSV03_15480 [Planctomycetota bacterium]|nr:MAG: hypothetical protein JSV03_15480 [Planctomycetota bacterium]